MAVLQIIITVLGLIYFLLAKTMHDLQKSEKYSKSVESYRIRGLLLMAIPIAGYMWLRYMMFGYSIRMLFYRRIWSLPVSDNPTDIIIYRIGLAIFVAALIYTLVTGRTPGFYRRMRDDAYRDYNDCVEKSKCVGKEKYLQRVMHADKAKKNMVDVMNAKKNLAFSNMHYYKDNSYAPERGGLAAAVSGSNLVGMAAAIRAENEAQINTAKVRQAAKQDYERLSSEEMNHSMGNLIAGSHQTSSALYFISRIYKDVPQNAVNNISFSVKNHRFTQGGHMMISVQLKADNYIENKKEYVLDGVLRVNVLRNGKKVGNAFVVGKAYDNGLNNIGFNMIEREIGALRNEGPKYKFKKGHYTFNIEPIALWGIEKLSSEEYEEIDKQLEPEPMFDDYKEGLNVLTNMLRM